LIIDINHLMQAKSPSAILGSMSHLRDDVDPRTTIRTRMNSSVDPNMVKPYCWMCSTNEGKKTNEHIFSISLRRLAEHNEFDSHRVNAITGEGYDKRNLQKLNSLLAGNVCASCNNGWMNKLEITVTPQIIDVPNRVLTSQEVQFWIRWIAKISVMINTSQNYRVQWKASQRHISNMDYLQICTYSSREWKTELNTMLTGCKVSDTSFYATVERYNRILPKCRNSVFAT